MARKRTREELETRLRAAEASEELVFSLFAGDCARRIRLVYGPRKIESGEFVFWLYGVDRASGGVIVGDRGVLGYAVDVCVRWHASGDPYLRDCVNQVHRAQKEFVEKRYAKALAATERP